MEQQERPLLLIEDIDSIGSEKRNPELYSGKYLFIVHCRTGKLQVTLNGCNYILEKKHLLLCLPEFLVGNFMRTPECRSAVLCMQAEYFTQLIDSTFHTEPRWWEKYTLLQQNPVVSIDEPGQQLLNGYYPLLKAYLNDKATVFRENMLLRLVELIYYEISRYFDGLVPELAGGQITQSDRIFRQFVDLLRREYITEREVRFYAQQLCITPKYLSTVCHEKSGKTASLWIQARLTEEIQRKLIETDLPVKELANRFNFPSQSFFGKYVKQHLGTSPKAYRIAHRINH